MPKQSESPHSFASGASAGEEWEDAGKCSYAG